MYAVDKVIIDVLATTVLRQSANLFHIAYSLALVTSAFLCCGQGQLDAAPGCNNTIPCPKPDENVA